MALFRRLGHGHQSLPVHRSEPNQIICNNFLATLTQSWRLACQIMAQTQGKVRMDTAAWTSQRVGLRRGDFEHPAELLPAMEPGPRLAAGHAATPSGYRQASRRPVAIRSLARRYSWNAMLSLCDLQWVIVLRYLERAGTLDEISSSAAWQ